ncbi:hypothetical protein DFJ73DRAFT_592985 [Zopfochytrium polystomum]|nr:hypothetical protein DFJ73DRAFT_592985 [Zopfochytrium polystomum]
MAFLFGWLPSSPSSSSSPLQQPQQEHEQEQAEARREVPRRRRGRRRSSQGSAPPHECFRSREWLSRTHRHTPSSDDGNGNSVGSDDSDDSEAEGLAGAGAGAGDDANGGDGVDSQNAWRDRRRSGAGAVASTTVATAAAQGDDPAPGAEVGSDRRDRRNGAEVGEGEDGVDEVAPPDGAQRRPSRPLQFAAMVGRTEHRARQALIRLEQDPQRMRRSVVVFAGMWLVVGALGVALMYIKYVDPFLDVAREMEVS